MMNNLFAISLMCTIVTIRCQVYFPEDSGNTYVNPYNLSVIPIGSNVGSDPAIKDTIAGGILKLTLSVDKIISNDQRVSSNLAVFSPVGISGALALLLLGATGKTFEELSAVLGLASGVDLKSNSQKIHEHFGTLFADLQKNTNVDVGAQVKFATAVFVQDDYPIRSIYKRVSEDIYKSEILNLDFKSDSTKAQNIINAWVAQRTNSKIKQMLSEPPPSDTRVIICSALYFLGRWEKPFFNGFTRKKPFFPNGAKSSDPVMIEMMSNGGAFPYYKDPALDCEILGFPYKGNKTTMYVVMPKNSNKETLRNFERRLTPEDVERLVENTKYTQTVILFPKMTLESTIDLRDSLVKLGAASLFNPRQANLALLSPGSRLKNIATDLKNYTQIAADVVKNPIAYETHQRKSNDDVLIFTRFGEPVNCTQVVDPTNNVTKCESIKPKRVARQIETLDGLRKVLSDTGNAENPGLYADQVIHKVYMDVTETGTEAAAATSVSLSRGGDIVTFRVDVPFLFFIRDEDSKLILFWGSVYNPPPSSH